MIIFYMERRIPQLILTVTLTTVTFCTYMSVYLSRVYIRSVRPRRVLWKIWGTSDVKASTWLITNWWLFTKLVRLYVGDLPPNISMNCAVLCLLCSRTAANEHGYVRPQNARDGDAPPWMEHKCFFCILFLTLRVQQICNCVCIVDCNHL